MKKYLLLIVLQFLFSKVCAQQDSLKAYLDTHTVNDTLRVQVLLKLGETFEQTSKDSALIIYKSVIDISRQLNYFNGEAKGFHYSGIVLSETGNPSEAIVNYEKAITLYKQAGNPRGAAGCKVNIGNVFYLQGIYSESLSNYLEALKEIERLHDSTRMALLYTNLGSLYQQLFEFDKAVSFQRKSLSVATVMNDSTALESALINLASTLVEKNRVRPDARALDSAEMFLYRSLAISSALAHPQNEYLCYNNLADLLSKKGSYKESLALRLKAFVKAKESDDPYPISSALLNVGVDYSNTGNNLQALEWVQQGIDLSIKHHYYANLSTGYNWLSQIQNELGRYKNSRESLLKAVIYNDSVSNQRAEKKIGQIEGKYELESQLYKQKQEEEKITAAKAAERSRRDTIQYSSITLAIFMLFAIVVFLGKLNISSKASHLITLITVLLLFEFLMVMLDPVIEKYSSGVPVYKLLMNMILALAIFPVHEWLLKILSKPGVAVNEAGQMR